MGQRKRKLIKLYIWLMFGVLFSIAIGMMKVNGSINVGSFFDQGEVYEFAPETFTKSTATWNYDPEFAAYFISNENAKKTLPEIKMYRFWTYIGLNVAALNRESAEITFSFYDKMGTNLWEQTSIISEGDNLISIQHSLKFRKVKMIVRNQPGLTMAIRSMQLKDTDLGFSVKEFVKVWVVFMVLYLIITGAFFVVFHVGLRERNWYTLIEILQYSYILFGNYFGKKWVFELKQKTRKHVRTGLFWALFMCAILYQTMDWYMNGNYYKYGVLLFTVALIFIAIFSWERPLQYVRWDGILPVTWILLWVGTCISDFAVSKHFKFTGYVFLFGIGFFFFMWNNMERPKQIRNDMIRGLELTFPVVLIFCMFFRQKIEGICYNGIYHQRNDMALYTLMILIAFLSKIFYYMCFSHSKEKEKWNILYSVGTTVSLYLLWQTQVKVCFVAAIVVIILFLYMLRKERKGYMKNTAAFALIGSILAVLILHISITKLPGVLHSNLVYKKDCFDTVYEKLPSENVDRIVLKKTRPVTEIHKRAIWKHYIRKMNSLGNENRLWVQEKRTMAHNGIIEMAYRYGIFILIPYIALLWICLYRAIQDGGYLVQATALSFGIVMMTQNIEQPFAHPLWIIFYLGMGIWFKEEDSERNIEKIEKYICEGLEKLSGKRKRRLQ